MRPAPPVPTLPVHVLTTLALLAAGCGPAADVGGRVDPGLEQELREGRSVRAVVLLDDGPAVAAARAAAQAPVAGGVSLEGVRALDAVKARVLASSTGRELRLLQRYAHLPALHVELASPAALERILTRPEVVRVVRDVAHERFLAESLPLIHQPAAAQAGASGRGTAVAVLDTGVDLTLPEFGDCPAPGAPGCRVVEARDFAPEDGALDSSGHGSNVAAIVAGVAPGANILALDVFEGAYAYTSALLAAIDWCVDHRATYGIVAINMSLGAGGSASPCQGDPLAGSIRTARAAGILTIVASGNGGQAGRIASPACAPEAVSVGAVYDADVGASGYETCHDASSGADQVACFSNSASFLTVLAPGAHVTAGGVTMVGTSQAAPHVAGAVAAIRSALPSASPDEVLALLRSGPMITDARNGVRTPRLDLAHVPPVRCPAELSPAAHRLGGAGGEVVVELTPEAVGCTWTVSTSAAWLELSPSTGSGPARVGLIARANAGPPRQAVVSAGGNVLVVSQGTDETIPTASLVFAAPFTRSLSVSATITTPGDPTGLAAMCLSLTPDCSAWQPFARSLEYSLPAGDAGLRTVYLRVRDGAGNVSERTASSILYDPAPPEEAVR